MKIDTIITLSNNSKYLLMDKTMIEDTSYFYAARVNNDSTAVTSEYIFLEERKKEAKTFVKIVEDPQLKEFLLTVYNNNNIDYAEKLENSKEEL